MKFFKCIVGGLALLLLVAVGCDSEPQTLREEAIEAQKDLEDAREEAAAIVSDAEADAVEMVAEARQDAKEEISDAKIDAGNVVDSAENKLQKTLEKLSDTPLDDTTKQPTQTEL